MGNLAETKPHVVLVPFPGQETILDGLTPLEDNGDVSQDIGCLCQSIRKNFLHPFGELLAKLQESAIAGVTPPVTCIVSDCYMPFTIQAAEEHALPTIIFNPFSACNFLTFLHIRKLLDKGVIPLKDRGLIASWCPQEQVLNHPSIGGFLIHWGWNSTIESICDRVPMLCWPFFADQPTNCRYICNKWEIEMEIDTNVKREEVEMLFDELMVGEKGKMMRQKVMELKKKAKENTSPGGCSYMNLDKVIKEVFLK
ncbi:hypothetical protein TSUD_276230 [Trifolium subterraneum]|uniref:UDP-glycosyltransferases domain-containing protein n=1 Tax=Trifolium subterraneum TaxID=3900 RepID=A0A2Z6N1I5_TRISU|nr:hypothetical protein TSUD_276230 [Trifolium subterraneum]